jgi:hypothetical protein
MHFSTAQAMELEALRARKEKVAAIRAAEKEEVSRAIAKARVVVELKTLGSQPKEVLRRTDPADADALVEDADNPLIEPEEGVARGVMRRRIMRRLNTSSRLASGTGSVRRSFRGGDAASAAGQSTARIQRIHSVKSWHQAGADGASVTSGGANSDNAFTAGDNASGRPDGASGALPSLRDLEEEDDGGDGRSSTAGAADILSRVSKPYRVPPGTPVVERVRLWLLSVLGSGVFGVLMMCLIVLNTVVLALDRYPVDEVLDARAELLNFALTITFALEMTAKMSAMGLRWYAKDRMNMFDAAVVLISLIELIASPPSFITGAANNNNAAVLALRTLRLARIFKLARSWTSLKLLLRMLSDSMQVMPDSLAFILTFTSVAVFNVYRSLSLFAGHRKLQFASYVVSLHHESVWPG